MPAHHVAALVLSGALAALTVPATAQRPEVDRNDLYAKVREASAQLIGNGVPAVMVVVVQDGKVLLRLAAGQATKDLPATLATLFPLGRASVVVANLTFARLVQQRHLDLDAKANECIAPLVLLDRDGDPLPVSLRDVLGGKSGLPAYRNLLIRKDLDRWSLEHAIADQGRSIFERHRSELDYGVLQLAAEKVMHEPWAEIVKSAVSEPMALRRLVVDARQGLPRHAALPHRRKEGQPPEVEPRCHSHLLAANGAWIDSPDMERLLLRLLHISRDRSDPGEIQALARERLEFNRFRLEDRNDEGHCHVALAGSMPGSSGGMRIYPQHRTAFAVFTNMSGSKNDEALETVFRVLDKQLLPPRKENEWSTAIGLGGGAGGGRRLPTPQRGEYVARLSLAGVARKLRARVNESGDIEQLQFGDRPAVVARSKRQSWGWSKLEGGDLLQLRPDLQGEDAIRSQMNFRCERRGGRTYLVGKLWLESPYFERTYPVRFEAASTEPEPRPASRATGPGKR